MKTLFLGGCALMAAAAVYLSLTDKATQQKHMSMLEKAGESVKRYMDSLLEPEGEPKVEG